MYPPLVQDLWFQQRQTGRLQSSGLTLDLGEDWRVSHSKGILESLITGTIMYNNCVWMTSLISSRALCPQRTYTGFIVTRTLPETYVYGIYRHAHSARHVRIWDLSSRAKLWNDSMRFRIIVYTHVTTATGSIYIYIIYIYICHKMAALGFP